MTANKTKFLPSRNSRAGRERETNNTTGKQSGTRVISTRKEMHRGRRWLPKETTLNKVARYGFPEEELNEEKDPVR